MGGDSVRDEIEIKWTLAMRIIVASSSAPDLGHGISTYAREIAEAMIGLGIEVHFVSPTPSDRSWLRKHGIMHVSTDQGEDPFDAALRVLEYSQDKSIDGIINNDNPIVQSIAPALSCPLIAVGHLDKYSIATLACFQPEWSDYVVAISQDMQRKFVINNGVPLTRCPVIYNGVRDRGAADKSKTMNRRKIRAIYVGGVNRRKGVDLLLKAIEKNSKAWEGVVLDWYGGASKKIKRILEDVPYVRLHGHVASGVLRESLEKADILLFPSRAEGCPMAMLEAMSYGVVPIASDGTGAMRYLVQSGLEGYVCNLRHWPEQMLECVKHLRDNPDILIAMKQAVRKRYLAEFQSKDVATKLRDLILRPTVDRKKPRREFTVLRWHRPLRPDGLKAPLLDRFYIRFGFLRRAGKLRISE
jgi:glycosyltransferase involved in cell wall biosynthesis